MIEFASLKQRTYSYLTDDRDENKKSRRHKKVCHKIKLKSEDKKYCLEATQPEKRTSRKIKLMQKILNNSLKKINIKNTANIQK